MALKIGSIFSAVASAAAESMPSIFPKIPVATLPTEIEFTRTLSLAKFERGKAGEMVQGGLCSAVRQRAVADHVGSDRTDVDNAPPLASACRR
jgi:hypothetical protein